MSGQQKRRRVAANDRELEHIDAFALPSGAEPLRLAELVARGLPSFVAGDGVSNIPRITRRVRLPAFEFDAMRAYSWPTSPQGNP